MRLRNAFGAALNMEYAILDINKDPADQGFDGRLFDLILLSNVLHTTPSLGRSLRHIRELLHIDGWLVMNELTSAPAWINYTFGILPDWWHGEADGRPDKPYVSAVRWEEELRQAGFRSPDAVVPDAEESPQAHTLFVARPRIDQHPEKHALLLRLDESSDDSRHYESLQSRGYAVERRVLTDEKPWPAGWDIIALLDREGPFFDGIDPARFASFKRLVSRLEKRGILWVTRLSQMQCQDPRYAQIHGVARTLRSEVRVAFAICEADDMDASSGRIVDVFERFQTRREEDDTLNPELEYVVANNVIYVGRLYPFSIHQALSAASKKDRAILHAGKPGRLDSLHWTGQGTTALSGEDVEIEVYAAGLDVSASPAPILSLPVCTMVSG